MTEHAHRFALTRWWCERKMRKAHAHTMQEAREITALLQHMGLPDTGHQERAYARAALSVRALERSLIRSTYINTATMVLNLALTTLNHGNWWNLIGWSCLALLIPLHYASLRRGIALRDEWLTHWDGPWPPVVDR